MSGKKTKGKNKTPIALERQQWNMRIVTSDTCAKCKKCAKGLKYLEKMEQPGAVGCGVPCILTRTRSS